MADKGGFPHHMLKEIFEQPEAIRDRINYAVRYLQTGSLGPVEEYFVEIVLGIYRDPKTHYFP